MIGRDADVDHSQMIGGMQSDYWEGYIPPSPPGFGTPVGAVKSDTVLLTVRHRCNISSKGAVLPGHNHAEMGLQTRYMLWHNTTK